MLDRPFAHDRFKDGTRKTTPVRHWSAWPHGHPCAQAMRLHPTSQEVLRDHQRAWGQRDPPDKHPYLTLTINDTTAQKQAWSCHADF